MLEGVTRDGRGAGALGLGSESLRATICGFSLTSPPQTGEEVAEWLGCHPADLSATRVACPGQVPKARIQDKSTIMACQA